MYCDYAAQGVVSFHLEIKVVEWSCSGAVTGALDSDKAVLVQSWLFLTGATMPCSSAIHFTLSQCLSHK